MLELKDIKKTYVSGDEKVEEPEEPGFFAKIINFFKGIIAAILGIFKK